MALFLLSLLAFRELHPLTQSKPPSMNTSIYLRCLSYLTCLSLASCINPNTEIRSTYLANHSEVLEGKQFKHRVWTKPAIPAEAKTENLEVLRIYIHGDGQPWLGATRIAADPSPKFLPAYELWQQDSAHAVLLGRPCYFSVQDKRCNAGYWTNARYSEEVVLSLAALVSHLSEKHKDKDIWLVGFSGGGALAALVANRVEQVNVLITLAAVLDTDAWTDYHDYSPLDHSLNPASIALRPELKQVHFVGEKDDIAPAKVNRRFYQRNDVDAIQQDHFDHECCWADEWLTLLTHPAIAHIEKPLSSH